MTVGIMVDGSGERKLRENRKRFWRMVGWGLAGGAAIGVVAGILAGFIRAHHGAGGAPIGWLIWPVLAGALFFFVRYSIVYFRRVDEVDLQDNLWSSLVALYGVIVALPLWSVLHEIGQAPRPDAWVLWHLALALALATYSWRKLRARF